MRSPFIASCKMTCDFKKKGNWKAGYHTGEDWVYVDKSHKVLVSPITGVCIRNEWSDSYGWFIVLQDKYSERVILMAHLSEQSSIKSGQKVVQSQPIGKIGETGNASGVHLHIEVEDRLSWKYNTDLVKPSDVIKFQQFYNEYFSEPLEWKNGSTKEYVYSNTADCSNMKNSIGYIFPYEKALCYGVTDGCFIVSYNIAGNRHKVGFVKYDGGVITKELLK